MTFLPPKYPHRFALVIQIHAHPPSATSTPGRTAYAAALVKIKSLERATTQLRSQYTAEWLPIAAIWYCALELSLYLFKWLAVFASRLDSEAATRAAAPFLAIVVSWAVNHAHRKTSPELKL